MKHMIDLSADDLATWAFQDKLSKFCPTDPRRPNGFESQMFKLGMRAGIERVLALLSTAEAGALTNNPILTAWIESQMEDLLK